MTAPAGTVSVTIARPDDWHVHLRDDAMLAAVAPYTARWFRKALIMPNLVPPVTTTAAARHYRERIGTAVADSGVAATGFDPVMTMYVTHSIDRGDLLEGFQQGIVGALKYYPAGATTNSDAGGAQMADFIELFAFMAEHQIPLAVHAESTDPTVDVYDREKVFIDRQLAPTLAAVPGLRVTVEHLSTRAGVEFVQAHPNAAGSITPHHLACDRTDLLANGLRPDLYCKPILNAPEDRAVLVAAATAGNGRFFLGTDSAPHPAAQKYTSKVSAGIFSAPYALPVVAEVFYQNSALAHLEAFVATNGSAHYRVQPSSEEVTLRRHQADSDADDAISKIVTSAGDEVTLFGVREAALWSVGDR